MRVIAYRRAPIVLLFACTALVWPVRGAAGQPAGAPEPPQTPAPPVAPPPPALPAAPAVPAPIGERVPIISSEITLSREEATLALELVDRTVTVSLRNGRAYVDGAEISTYRTGGALDQSWRALLRAASDATADELPVLLAAWRPPDGSPGDAMVAALAQARTGIAQAEPPPASGPAADTVTRLQMRIEALERMLRELERDADQVRPARTPPVRPSPPTIQQRVFGFAAHLASVLGVFFLLLGTGFVLVFFGRRYLEGVADTVRHATLRSGLVGLAGAFLLVPAFAAGCVVLAVTIIGIPLLLVWAVFFPLAAALAMVLGYLAVAHAAGEALAERRLHGGEWVRANSYYFLASGLILLLAVFAAIPVADLLSLDFLFALLIMAGTAVTLIALTLGFGAVLLSRCGTRPVRGDTGLGSDPGFAPSFEEESHV